MFNDFKTSKPCRRLQSLLSTSKDILNWFFFLTKYHFFSSNLVPPKQCGWSRTIGFVMTIDTIWSSSKDECNKPNRYYIGFTSFAVLKRVTSLNGFVVTVLEVNSSWFDWFVITSFVTLIVPWAFVPLPKYLTLLFPWCGRIWAFRTKYKLKLLLWMLK